MTIDEMIRRKKELGYTYEMISEYSNVPLGTVQKVLGGITRSPRYDTLQALERVLSPDAPYPPATHAGKKSGDGAPAGSLIQEAPAPYGSALPAAPEPPCASSQDRRRPPVRIKCIGGIPDRESAASTFFPGRRQGEFSAADRNLLPDDCRTELIDGVLYDMASPKPLHQMINGELYIQIRQQIDACGQDCYPLMAPFDVYIDRDDRTVVQPDLLVICGDFPGPDEYYHGSPAFIAEILSSSTRTKDMTVKLTKYLSAGVREYWIVDPEKRKIIVYQLNDEMEISIYGFDAVVPIGISDGRCSIDFSEIGRRLTRFVRDWDTAEKK